ncbi:MAG: hypothetical protein LBI55_03355 [Oscillospiraceae bacterium]|jgi:hypothetical protein|nr:hypothetical protein [Oscillospiraceae bacterium]
MCALKRSQLKIGAIIKPDGFPEGKIATVENCSLENFVDGDSKKEWPCWTVMTNVPKPLHKYLIVDWGKEDGVIIWTKSNMDFAPIGSKLLRERSGLEEMKNIYGDEPENYIYSLVTYVLDYEYENFNKFYCIERLRDQKIFRYEGQKINIDEEN